MKEQRIITLTTDFGLKDSSVGKLKAILYSSLPYAEIVDISHAVSPFHIIEASYIIKNAYRPFPSGTIHILGIDSENTLENDHLLVQMDGHFFICADNGILSLIASEIKPDRIIRISNINTSKTPFPELTFAHIAAQLVNGASPESLGESISNLRYTQETEPVVNSEKDQIIGYVLYIDHYGNVVTNIKKRFFEDTAKGRNFLITARAAKFREIYSTYSDAIDFSLQKEVREEDGKKLAIFNSAGYIELAVYKSNHSTVGSASALFGLSLRDTVTINFS
ncbi:hypothetical protein GCM10007103_14030 [Salinimicrobium marinum]|uniref:SAM-dependent chlorinase/fluorinase n=1 Tax=Salinimicrobium marinum TaxID=680283 RepID=A0A918VXT9_9FLAO|nr:SAM-dependent chlorinase/fluorinase [Salinimicrobium marinum]GHA33670.1 hypothetical protein GCM10007103_14030 [Salinimicrobium marinum]